MRTLTLLVWLAVPLSLYGIHSTLGSPHLLGEYTFEENGARYDPFVPRDYTSCTYVGWRLRAQTVPANNGKCRWVRLLTVAD